MKPWQLASVLCLIPLIAFAVGSRWMNRAAGPLNVQAKPLNERPFGYGIQDIRIYWESLNRAGTLSVQQRLLEYDFFFPVVYGGALAASLLAAWLALGQPTGWNFVAVLVVFAMIADWAENTFLLQLLKNYMNNAGMLPDPLMVAIACAATILKFFFLGVSGIALLLFAFKILQGGP